MTMRLVHVSLAVVLCAALALTACGTSKEDKAMSSVCDARADIGKQVDKLRGLTLSTATLQDVQRSLTAIGDDLSKIKNAQGDLGDRQKQVQQANDAFTSQVKDIVGSLGRNLSASNAGSKFTTAVQQLASGYRRAFAPVDCS
jgi:flagellin-like hook-associated protein FlgL